MLVKFISLLICFSLTCVSVHALSAQSAVLIDAHTGRVLMAQNANQRMGMASTTKIMTALVAIEEGNLDDVVTVSDKASRVEGSSMYLKSGEKILLRDLIYGLMLNSGNDAATAIAEHVGGDIESFADMMTQKAISLGLENSSFTNPHGLDNENHYTTAYELAQITRHALSNPLFSEISSTKVKTVGLGEGEQTRTLSNHNKMLSMYKGADGVKTGFTKKCGRCLVSSATRDCLRLIAVTLNAPNDWNDHTEMLNYGFNAYKWKNPVISGEYMRTVPVIGSDTDRISLYAEESVELAVNNKDVVRVVYNVPNFIDAPVSAGQQIGNVDVYLAGDKVKTVNLITKEDVNLTNTNKYRKTFGYLVTELLSLMGG